MDVSFQVGTYLTLLTSHSRSYTLHNKRGGTIGVAPAKCLVDRGQAGEAQSMKRVSIWHSNFATALYRPGEHLHPTGTRQFGKQTYINNWEMDHILLGISN